MSVEQAVYDWRNIPQSLERSGEDFTDVQKQILNISNDKIKRFYHLEQECKSKLVNTLRDDMINRMVMYHSYHNKHQCDQTPTRSINLLKMRNIEMFVEDKYFDTIKKAYHKNSDCPILEQLKNYQIFNIGNFDNSKGAFIVHDIYDHFWFAIKLENAGIFKNYSHLLFSWQSSLN